MGGESQGCLRKERRWVHEKVKNAAMSKSQKAIPRELRLFDTHTAKHSPCRSS
ncbi:hypothetical protein SESBI_48703 [Sesbania bispinosa]|nr:hypothetical protein SESBI_48703 [Sesbania bispinosa]